MTANFSKTQIDRLGDRIRKGSLVESDLRLRRSFGEAYEAVVLNIAGCRVIVTDIADQERVVALLRTAFPDVSVIDRRKAPSYGYRAVHVIASNSGKLIEIQVRTSLQHLWAELSEKFSDVYDPSIKYGGGEETIRSVLMEVSEVIAKVEASEKHHVSAHHPEELERGQEIEKVRAQLTEILDAAICGLEKRKGKE